MQVIDLHCDTLYKSVMNGLPLDSNSMEMQLADSPSFSRRLQCCAIWIPDNLSGSQAEALFHKSYDKLKNECKRLNIHLAEKNESAASSFNNNKISVCFTVENASALNGKIESVRKFAQCGVKIMTLTWNDSNEVGDGADIKDGRGITRFGKSVVKEMEKNSIVVDVSHASDRLFYSVAEIATLPFIATHSNSRGVTPHRRNLTDEQFKIIRDNNGIVGLNFHNAFLCNDPSKADICDLLRHTDHFLALNGENTLSLGSDFDGCDLANGIENSFSLYNIYELFLRHNYSEELINKIFYKNALKFFENFDNH